MLRDRKLSLIRRAVFSGKIKAEEVRFLDLSWWRWLYSLLDFIEQDELSEVVKLKFLFYCSLIPSVNAESFEKTQNLAIATHWSYLDLKLPWIASNQPQKSPHEEKIEKLTQQWVELFGDPESPETKAKIEETIQTIIKNTKAGEKVTSPTKPRN